MSETKIETERRKRQKGREEAHRAIAYIRAPIMHLKTVKCNQNCVIATLADLEVFNNPESQVRR